MGSDAQNEANRRNAKRSAGPVTKAGKAISCMNALKWGLSSPDGRALLPTENQEEFEEFAGALLADRKPVGALEELAAAELISSSWRLRRAANIELGILANGVVDADERYLHAILPRLEAHHAALLRATGTGDLRKGVVIDPGLAELIPELMYEANATKETDAARL